MSLALADPDPDRPETVDFLSGPELLGLLISMALTLSLVSFAFGCVIFFGLKYLGIL